MSTVLVKSLHNREIVARLSTSPSSSIYVDEPLVDRPEKTLDAQVSLPEDVPLLGIPKEEKRFWFQRSKAFGWNAIATQVCNIPRLFHDSN